MKNTSKEPTKAASNKKLNKPENKDNLDSREGEEQLVKGKNVTHNKKEKHSARKQ